eukprot:TRINITY_DN2196_c0_g1_i6.p1 TRINITY_DN2196_c0_g1~~TRINITY_DN2196_c0_g1_i6.p1  ORF type:complete len:1633 (+),score=360.94 TRINITY_DN2196_c0_g1_i6:592-4899(+)
MALSESGKVVVSAQAWGLVRERCQGKPAEVKDKDKDKIALCYQVSNVKIPVELAHINLPSLPCSADKAAAAVRGYIPAPVLTKIDAGQADWLAETRTVTVLFVYLPDVKNDQTLVLDDLQRMLTSTQTILVTWDGFLRQFIIDDKGCVLIAGFGVPPHFHEDNAVRAVRAALAIHESLRAMNFASSIGITTGKAFCGIVGCENRREYAMVGAVVNMSARLMVLAKQSVICDASTMEAAKDVYEFVPLTPKLVKGRTAPVLIFAPSSLRDANHRLLKKSATVSTLKVHKLIGREQERKIFRDMSSRLAEGGHGNVLVIEADAGMGQSALLHNLRAAAQQQSLLVCYNSCGPQETTTAYASWRPVFATLLQAVFPDVHGSEVLSALSKAMVGVVDDFDSLAPLLNPLLAHHFAASAYSQQLPAEDRPAMTRDLCLACLEYLCDPKVLTKYKGVAFFFEDAHWMDPASRLLTLAVLRNIHVPVLEAEREAQSPGHSPARQTEATPGTPENMPISLSLSMMARIQKLKRRHAALGSDNSVTPDGSPVPLAAASSHSRASMKLRRSSLLPGAVAPRPETPEAANPASNDAAPSTPEAPAPAPTSTPSLTVTATTPQRPLQRSPTKAQSFYLGEGAPQLAPETPPPGGRTPTQQNWRGSSKADASIAKVDAALRVAMALTQKTSRKSDSPAPQTSAQSVKASVFKRMTTTSSSSEGSLPPTHALLVLASRPLNPPPAEWQHADFRSVKTVRLRPYTIDEVSQIICQEHGCATIDEELREFLFQKGGGSALYSLQISHVLKDRDHVFVENNHFSKVSGVDLSAAELPTTLQDVVLARLDRLAATSQFVLKVASVVGVRFSTETLCDIFPVEEFKAETAMLKELGGLQAGGFIMKVSNGWEFCHLVTRDAAYSVLPEQQRRTLHAAVVTSLEKRQRADLSPFYATIAYHATAAQQIIVAAQYWEAAGAIAFENSDHKISAECFENIFKITQNLTGETEVYSATRRPMWHRYLAVAYIGLHQTILAVHHAEQSLELMNRPFPKRFLAVKLLKELKANRDTRVLQRPRFSALKTTVQLLGSDRSHTEMNVRRGRITSLLGKAEAPIAQRRSALGQLSVTEDVAAPELSPTSPTWASPPISPTPISPTPITLTVSPPSINTTLPTSESIDSLAALKSPRASPPTPGKGQTVAQSPGTFRKLSFFSRRPEQLDISLEPAGGPGSARSSMIVTTTAVSNALQTLNPLDIAAVYNILSISFLNSEKAAASLYSTLYAMKVAEKEAVLSEELAIAYAIAGVVSNANGSAQEAINYSGLAWQVAERVDRPRVTETVAAFNALAKFGHAPWEAVLRDCQESVEIAARSTFVEGRAVDARMIRMYVCMFCGDLEGVAEEATTLYEHGMQHSSTRVRTAGILGLCWVAQLQNQDQDEDFVDEMRAMYDKKKSFD